jgi:hypothetical protein
MYVSTSSKCRGVDKRIQDQPVLDTRQIANVVIGEERQPEEKVEIRIDPGGFGTL